MRYTSSHSLTTMYIALVGYKSLLSGPHLLIREKVSLLSYARNCPCEENL